MVGVGMQGISNVTNGKYNMNKPKLIVMIGIPGSGKSTFARHYVEQANLMTTIWVSRDDIRYSLLSDGDDYFSKEKDVFEFFIKAINAGLADGMDVIADATHLNSRSRKKLLSRITVPNIQIEACVMETPLEKCLENNAKRSGKACVPEKVILDMFHNFEYPTFQEGFTTIATVK